MNAFFRCAGLLIYLVGVTACSGGGGGGTQAGPPPTPAPMPVNPTPPPTNSAPTLSLSSAFEIEDGRYFFGSVSVSDNEGDEITLTLTGEDAALFEVTSTLLTSKSTLDFDVPGDADRNNVYKLTMTASDGVNATSQDLQIFVRDILRDGFVRILHVESVESAGDITGDGLDEIIVRPLEGPEGELKIAGIVLPRAAILSESPAVYDALAPTGDATAIPGSLTLLSAYDVGSNFNAPFASGYYMSTTGLMKYAAVVTSNLLTGVTYSPDASVLMPDETDLASLGESILLSGDPLPAGLRSTRDQVARPLGAFIPVGDFDADGFSEVIPDLFGRLNSPAGIEDRVRIVGGRKLKGGSANDLFAGLTDPDTQAISVTFASARYNSLGNTTGQDPYREPGTADVDGDGIDDFIWTIGLRGDAPVDNSGDPLPQGFEINVFSGRRLMDRGNGSYDAESFAKPDVLRITTPESLAEPAVVGIGDVDNDGFSDLLIYMYNGPPPIDPRSYELYIVSGAALVSDADGVIALGLEEQAGVTGINTSLGAAIAPDAFIAGNIIADAGDDVVVTLSRRGGYAMFPHAIILSDRIFAAGFPPRIDLVSQSGLLSDATAGFATGSYSRIDGPGYPISAVLNADGSTGFRGWAGFSSVGSTGTGGVSIGDVDGDGRPELALVYYTNDQSEDMLGETSDLFIINSRALEASRKVRASILLHMDFDEYEQ